MTLQCPDHPKYKAMRPPRVQCQPCMALWALSAAKACLKASQETAKKAIAKRRRQLKMLYWVSRRCGNCSQPFTVYNDSETQASALLSVMVDEHEAKCFKWAIPKEVKARHEATHLPMKAGT